MSSKSLCRLIRLAVAASAVCGALLALWVVPEWGRAVAEANPEFAYCYVPWLSFIWLAAVPCFAVLVYIWRVSGAILRDEVFTLKTAGWIHKSAVILFADIGFFFAGNIVLLLLNMNHPGILLLSLLADIFASALALLAAVLSRYITKAAELQEVSEGMI
ncbi:MAG: DUF2975 domain-containing protein [Oscillospiraceae bacterium]|nr:DUF2975 domain-containing protein [Oscillospiraceae bacterium]